MSPNSDAVNMGGEQVNGFAGLNFYIPNGTFEGVRLGLEYGLPWFQDLHGIQMENQSFLTLGLKYGWH